MLNLSSVLEDSAREQPDRDAVVLDDLRFSYSAVNGVANQVAHLLRSRGIGRGDKVALCCPNLPYFPMVYFGILKTGAVAVPLNVLLDPWEFAYHLDDSNSKAIFCFEGTADLPIAERGYAGFQQADVCEYFFVLAADPASTASPFPGAEPLMPALAGKPTTFGAVATQPGDTAVILYGSGTTGRLAMGSELSHMSMLLNAMVVDSMFDRGGHDVFLVSLPLFHSFGQTVCMNTGFLRRATLVLQPRFEPVAALGLMARERVTFFAGVPTMYWALLACVTAESSDCARISDALTVAVSGGASLPMAVLKGFAERFGVDVLEGYGLSEASPVTSFNRPDRAVRPGSIGLPVWGVEMKLIDPNWKDIPGEGPGEIAIRGHNVMKGYYRRAERTEEVLRDGWLRTGDIARRDEDGYYYIIDRSRDLIVRSGVRVYPREVEEALMAHPEVSLAAVIGVPHDRYGEEIKAYVIRSSGSAIGEHELMSWGKHCLPPGRWPRIVVFRDKLPMTATGKILKRELQ